MKLVQLFSGSLLLVPLITASAWPAFPAGQIAEFVENAQRGCRWRRCVTVAPRMPRADEGPVAVQPARLQLNFDKGPPYYVELNTDTKQIMRVMGQEVAQQQTQVFYLKMTPLGKNQGGYAQLRMQILGVKMKIDIGGVNIDYDSTQNRPVGESLASFFRILVNADLLFAIDPKEAKIESIEGHEELIRKIGVTSPQMEPLLQKILSKEALAQMIEPGLFGFLPRQPVRPGDTWGRPSRLDLGPIGAYRTDAEFTYQGTSGNDDKIAVQTTLRFDPPKQPQAGLPFQIQKVEVTSAKGAGDILFDRAKGRLAESTGRQALAAKLAIEVGGMATAVELEQTQTTRVRVRDVNPLSGKKQ